MDIIFHGRHDSQQAMDSLLDVIKLFYERYDIGHFREMHLSLTLVDEQGADVELVDTDTNQALRVFEIYQKGQARIKRRNRPNLKLVVNKEW